MLLDFGEEGGQEGLLDLKGLDEGASIDLELGSGGPVLVHRLRGVVVDLHVEEDFCYLGGGDTVFVPLFDDDLGLLAVDEEMEGLKQLVDLIIEGLEFLLHLHMGLDLLVL